MIMSRVYRFHRPAAVPKTGKSILLRKHRKASLTAFRLIAADECSVTDSKDTRPIEAYQYVPGQINVTLTKRESDLIALANPGVRPPVALEDLHPWLPEQRYLNNSAASFEALKSVVKRFARHLVAAADFCDEKWNTICNTLRKKNMWDARFYTAWHLPIQDVYVLEERRPDRSVVAIDFNGMYLACMQQSFPKPSGLKLVQLDTWLSDSTVLTCGLYRCILELPISDFIIRHNPFRSFHSGRHLRTRLDEPVEVDLNEFELEFFRRHFQRIYLIEAVLSDEEVRHPLAKEVRRSFANRRNFRYQGNKALADREKYLATLITSCAHRPARPYQSFETRAEAMTELAEMYGVAPANDEPEVAIDSWLQGRKGIELRVNNDKSIVQAPNTLSGSACFLLGQRIVARARIVLMEMMERILERAPSVEICYTNIDSIHFSLPTTALGGVLQWLEAESSDALGSFKIETVARHGLWLEPGRYWLYSDDVVKFRNRSIGNRLEPFEDHVIHVINRQLGGLHVPIKATVRMERSMSSARSLCAESGTGQYQQRLIEVGDTTTFSAVLDELEKNQRYSTPLRLAAFANLQERMESPRSAVTKRGENADVM
jgi:hypothetical protein